MSDFDDFISSLTSDVLPVRATSPTVKHPCGQCNGTGLYRGPRVHQEKAHCFACKGTGFFVTSEAKRRGDALKREEKRRAANRAHAEYIAAFAQEHPDMYAELKVTTSGFGFSTEFIASLATQLFVNNRVLTENQIAAYYRDKAKLEAMVAQREAEAPKVDLSAVEALFAAVVARGYKKPTYRAEGFVISLAGSNSVNAGALYIKAEEGAYLGKLQGGILRIVREFRQEEHKIAAELTAIATDPKGAALRYGQRTGKCACCGRELTNHGSIDAGIGPICAQKWGFV